MNNEPKPFLQKLKLYFSTVFSRTMTRAIFGTPNLGDNQILFSNITLQEAELYSPDPEYFIHLVTIKDTEFLEDLFEQFPLFKQGIVLLYVDKFFSGLNKNTGSLSDIKLFNKNNKIFLSVLIDRVSEEYECGEIISEYQAMRYYDVFNSGVINRSTAAMSPLENKIADTDKLTILDLGKLFNDFSGTYTCALLNNRSTIAIKNFVKNSKVGLYTHTVLATREKDAVRLNILFSCPIIEVVSTQPAVVWFPKRTKQ